jgi:hypothetical protein
MIGPKTGPRLVGVKMAEAVNTDEGENARRWETTHKTEAENSDMLQSNVNVIRDGSFGRLRGQEPLGSKKKRQLTHHRDEPGPTCRRSRLRS